MYNSIVNANKNHARDESPTRLQRVMLYKHVDKFDDDKFYNGSPEDEPLSNIAQGTQAYERIGLQVTLVSLALRLIIRPDAATTGITKGDIVRVRLIYNKRGGTIYGFNDAVKGYTSTGVAITNGEAFQNPESLEQFDIIAEWSFGFGANYQATTGTPTDYWLSNGPATGIIDTTIDLGGRKVRYTSASSSAILYGGLELWLSARNAAVANDWEYDFSTRLTFTDN